MLDEDEKQDKLVSSTKNRKCWIFFDKFSQHWEVECQDMPEAEFYHRFRKTRPTISKLLYFIKDDISPQQNFGDGVPADKRLAITLRYLATGGDLAAHYFTVIL